MASNDSVAAIADRVAVALPLRWQWGAAVIAAVGSLLAV